MKLLDDARQLALDCLLRRRWLPGRRLIFGGDDRFLAREGLTREVAPWEDGLRADPGPGSFEWWYVDARLDDGTTVVITFHTKPITERRGPLNPCLGMTLTRPDGHKTTRLDFHPASSFRAARDRCDVAIGPSRVHAEGGRYIVHHESAGVTIDLDLEGLVPGWRPGTGKNYYSASLDRCFAWLAPVPHGRVRATLAHDGATRTVEGTGYHDHNWGDVDLAEVLDHWYWGRAHLGPYTVIFVMETSTRAYREEKIPVFMLARDDRILVGEGRPLTLDLGALRPHPSGHGYPSSLDFRWRRGGDRVEVALRAPEVIEAESLLMYLPRWKQRLAALVTNPYYFRFRGDLTLTVDLDGAHDRLEGQALYELMMLD